MWIVRVALQRPYTFVDLALLILILSPVVILRTPTDIFPNVDIPVIAVAFAYTGLNPEEMEGRITTVFERVPGELIIAATIRFSTLSGNIRNARSHPPIRPYPRHFYSSRAARGRAVRSRRVCSA